MLNAEKRKTTKKEVEGVSAVKALQLAAQQGQTIYTITNKNKAKVLPKLSHRSDVMKDVTNALHAGYEVTISEKQINFHGWKGSGYIIIDPNNGSGAYLISGGANGAVALFQGAVLGNLISLFTVFVDVVIHRKVANAQLLAGSIVILIPFILGFILGVLRTSLKQGWGDKEWGCFWNGVLYNLNINYSISGVASQLDKIYKGKLLVTSIVGAIANVSGLILNDSLTSPKDCLK